MTTVEAIVQEASHVPVFLPNVSALSESLKKATEWSDKVDKVQVRTRIHYFHMTHNAFCFWGVVIVIQIKRIVIQIKQIRITMSNPHKTKGIMGLWKTRIN